MKKTFLPGLVAALLMFVWGCGKETETERVVRQLVVTRMEGPDTIRRGEAVSLQVTVLAGACEDIALLHSITYGDTLVISSLAGRNAETPDCSQSATPRSHMLSLAIGAPGPKYFRFYDGSAAGLIDSLYVK
ncbi:hypothetical protein [Chitinophaga caseinilytica]|uniref:hypothetical protein n=1 Tax=Chitinophaga caseinilytica TaxID=2267521 RepID=UPI003C2C3B1C